MSAARVRMQQTVHFLILVLTVVAVPLQAQSPATPRVLTLEDALRLAEEHNEQVAMARAGVTRAAAGELRVQSERKPQLAATGSYDRALASEFEGLFDAGTFGGNAAGGGDAFEDLPFGQANTFRLNLSFSQNLYSGGRIGALERQAQVGRTLADLGLKSTIARLHLDVAQAYYDAALTDRLVTIAEATLAQSTQTFEQTRTQREAGRMSEFDQLRAQVARDTLQPLVIRQRATRDILYLRLKQLLDLPADAAIQLAANLDADELTPAPAFAEALARAAATVDRLAVDEARTALLLQEAAIDGVLAQRRPALALTSAYGRVAYPSGFPVDFRTNWTVSVGGSMPLFTGGRIAAEEAAARADLAQGKARLQLTQELASLDAENARRDLTASQAAWEATKGTIQQAQRAYEIAELRFREGVGTQLELSDARLLRQQAEANRARAARDVQLSRARLALLPGLPLGLTGSAMMGGTLGAQ